ncbi:hypothetical protein [Nocardia nova]|uniref:hypothetical protein n=1 Tax=Nocardia nova TaxID=37330 RepID=UPI0033F029F1
MDDDVWTGRYLQRHDGSWWVVGEDGWSTSVEDLLAVRDGLASMVRDLPDGVGELFSAEGEES